MKYISSIVCFLIAVSIGIGDSIIFNTNETGNSFKEHILFMLITIVFVGLGEFFLVKALPEKLKKIKFLFIVQQFCTIVFLIISLLLAQGKVQ